MPVAAELAGHQAEVAADLDDDSTRGTAADLGGDLLVGGLKRERGAPRGRRARCHRGRTRLVEATRGGLDVAAAGGTLQQPGLEGSGEAEAAGDAQQDGRDVGGGEAAGTATEVGVRVGAGLAERVGEVAAEVEQAADEADQTGDGWGGVWGFAVIRHGGMRT